MSDGGGTGRDGRAQEAGAIRMADVSGKPATARVARAAARVVMRPETLAVLRAGGLAKGDALQAARVAGILAAKRTADLIPLCHPLPLSHVAVRFEVSEEGVVAVHGEAKTTAETGVEMEALTAVAVAALTIYDMCKPLDRQIVIDGLRLTFKSGGKSGPFSAGETAVKHR